MANVYLQYPQSHFPVVVSTILSRVSSLDINMLTAFYYYNVVYYNFVQNALAKEIAGLYQKAVWETDVYDNCLRGSGGR